MVHKMCSFEEDKKQREQMQYPGVSHFASRLQTVICTENVNLNRNYIFNILFIRLLSACLAMSRFYLARSISHEIQLADVRCRRSPECRRRVDE